MPPRRFAKPKLLKATSRLNVSQVTYQFSRGSHSPFDHFEGKITIDEISLK
jgi:hypothetical protein